MKVTILLHTAQFLLRPLMYILVRCFYRPKFFSLPHHSSSFLNKIMVYFFGDLQFSGDLISQLRSQFKTPEPVSIEDIFNDECFVSLFGSTSNCREVYDLHSLFHQSCREFMSMRLNFQCSSSFCKWIS